MDLMGTRDASGGPIDGSAKADAQGAGVVFAHQRRKGLFELPPDAVRAFGWIDCKPLATRNGGLGVTHHHLQFGAANFDAEESGMRVQRVDQTVCGSG